MARRRVTPTVSGEPYRADISQQPSSIFTLAAEEREELRRATGQAHVQRVDGCEDKGKAEDPERDHVRPPLPGRVLPERVGRGGRGESAQVDRRRRGGETPAGRQQGGERVRQGARGQVQPLSATWLIAAPVAITTASSNFGDTAETNRPRDIAATLSIARPTNSSADGGDGSLALRAPS